MSKENLKKTSGGFLEYLLDLLSPEEFRNSGKSLTDIILDGYVAIEERDIQVTKVLHNSDTFEIALKDNPWFRNQLSRTGKLWGAKVAYDWTLPRGRVVLIGDTKIPEN